LVTGEQKIGLHQQEQRALYSAFQAYFRKHKPPLLAAWGKNDPLFLPQGAVAFKREHSINPTGCQHPVTTSLSCCGLTCPARTLLNSDGAAPIQKANWAILNVHYWPLADIRLALAHVLGGKRT
jgi:hypothetical protein